MANCPVQLRTPRQSTVQVPVSNILNCRIIPADSTFKYALHYFNKVQSLRGRGNNKPDLRRL